MDQKEQGSHSGLIFVAIVVLCLCVFVAIHQVTGGFTGQGMNNNVKTYESMSKLIGSYSLKLNIPDKFVNTPIVEAKKVLGSTAEVYSESFVLKISTLVDYKADILGLYESCETDEGYYVGGSNALKYFRYRKGYPEYEHCTIINWCDESMTYGIMLADVYDIDAVLDIFGIKKENLIPVENETSSKDENEETDENVFKYTGEKFDIELVKLSADYNIQEIGSVAYIRYNEQTFGIIVCSIEDFNNFYDQENTEAIQFENNCYLLYRKLNSFDENSQDYNDYNKFINTINGISISIKN